MDENFANLKSHERANESRICTIIFFIKFLLFPIILYFITSEIELRLTVNSNDNYEVVSKFNNNNIKAPRITSLLFLIDCNKT